VGSQSAAITGTHMSQCIPNAQHTILYTGAATAEEVLNCDQRLPGSGIPRLRGGTWIPAPPASLCCVWSSPGIVIGACFVGNEC
jgi:hypothetical protein